MPTKTLEDLIKEIRNSAIRDYNKLKGKEKKDFPIAENVPVTLFGPAGNGQHETSYTRALAFLLNQKENHGFKRSIFDQLCKEVNFHALSAENYDVISEFLSKDKNDGGEEKINRFDIRIDGHRKKTNDKFLMIIEAKINADFGKEQLDKYCKYLNKQKKATNKYLITITKEKIDFDYQGINCKSLTWYDVFDIIWEIIKKQKNKNKKGFNFAQMFCASISQDIYGNDTEWSDIYNFVDIDQKVLKDIQEDIQKKEEILTEKLYNEYPMTCAVISNHLENKKYVKQFNDIRKNLKNFLESFNFGKVTYETPFLLRAGKWNKEKKQGLYFYIITKMDNNNKEKLRFVVSFAYTSIEKKKIAEQKIKEEIITSLPKAIKSWPKNIILYECDYSNKKDEKIKKDVGEILLKIKKFI